VYHCVCLSVSVYVRACGVVVVQWYFDEWIAE